MNETENHWGVIPTRDNRKNIRCLNELFNFAVDVLSFNDENTVFVSTGFTPLIFVV